ncbi:uncharacterized protein BDR25DRAFT_374188 [Lindgomyces ingoldianus]|uniref:Uncharacterized protein n=1 Tax=Lindgomyces ingoldianus TaxID=673940 RepID=A0ACB6QP61_9PLEO|nr:uncharacterized protein BDR25DRAFT_374188 [Lindgomyces ingoldianus]KAF2467900.1 hypothetical protein BDR25DRAFT_374188 [Lindgomyces ingoldianus]
MLVEIPIPRPTSLLIFLLFTISVAFGFTMWLQKQSIASLAHRLDQSQCQTDNCKRSRPRDSFRKPKPWNDRDKQSCPCNFQSRSRYSGQYRPYDFFRQSQPWNNYTKRSNPCGYFGQPYGRPKEPLSVLLNLPALRWGKTNDALGNIARSLDVIAYHMNERTHPDLQPSRNPSSPRMTRPTHFSGERLNSYVDPTAGTGPGWEHVPYRTGPPNFENEGINDEVEHQPRSPSIETPLSDSGINSLDIDYTYSDDEVYAATEARAPRDFDRARSIHEANFPRRLR